MDRRVSRSSETAGNNLDSSLILPNIRHKYGTSLVEQLISPEQVKRVLSEAEEPMPHTKRYHIPTPNLNSWPLENMVYYELGHCLRANLFPGAPMRFQTLTKDSYSIEVNKKGIVDKHTAHHWYGRKTDDLGRWNERNFMYINLRKALDKKDIKS
uniref:Uncharacterized protein n=1 Tax=Leptobrachium leishanense TaxID=445787 RepID=A0A8C5QSQ6_9ANUR